MLFSKMKDQIYSVVVLKKRVRGSGIKNAKENQTWYCSSSAPYSHADRNRILAIRSVIKQSFQSSCNTGARDLAESLGCTWARTFSTRNESFWYIFYWLHTEPSSTLNPRSTLTPEGSVTWLTGYYSIRLSAVRCDLSRRGTSYISVILYVCERKKWTRSTNIKVTEQYIWQYPFFECAGEISKNMCLYCIS